MIPNWLYESKWFPWSSRINFIPSRIFRDPLFHKPVTGQELFFCCFLQQTDSRDTSLHDLCIMTLLGTSIAKKKEKLRAKKNQTCRNKCSIYIYDWLRDKLQTFFFIFLNNKFEIVTMTTQQNWATFLQFYIQCDWQLLVLSITSSIPI